MPDFTLSDLAQNLPQVLSTLPLSRQLRAQIEASLDTTAAHVLANRAAQMPVLAAVAAGLPDHPFQGLRAVMVLHFLRDLLYFVGACQEAASGELEVIQVVEAAPRVDLVRPAPRPTPANPNPELLRRP